MQCMHLPRVFKVLASCFVKISSSRQSWCGLLSFVGFCLAPQAEAGNYLIGRGMSDITGEAAEVRMMGYAHPDQIDSGIHMRQRARAFIIVDQISGRRVVFVNNDLGMVFQGVQQEVLRRLTAKYGALYQSDNVILSATHTHSGPGGFSHYALYNITTLGFNQKTWEAIVSGIVRSISLAHDDLKPGSMQIGTGQLSDANVNRALPAYLNNPADERARWSGTTDTSMTVLRFKQGNNDVGMISWFATHGVSMTPSNTLISPDNKGYAAYRWEHDLRGVRYASPQDFVAAFAQTNAGDMSPNLNGDGTGPTMNEFDNTRIIGERQFQAALGIYNGQLETIDGPIDYRQKYFDMSNQTVAAAYTGGQIQHTCPAALGNAFAAGTPDGRGADGFTEGDLKGNPFLAWLGGVILPTPQWIRDCQAPKPVLFAPGIQTPFPWSPEVLPVSVVRIGQLYLLAAPGEFTIMSGRRARAVVKNVAGDDARYLVFAGYSNAYSGYVTTPEEYDIQYYEGGSTHFGRYTLPAYLQAFNELATDLKTGSAVNGSLSPRWLGDRQITFQTGVVLDNVPLFKSFGDVITDAPARVSRGTRVTVEFWTGHPKNNLHQNGTFLEVQFWNGRNWQVVASDADWTTQYRWIRVDPVWGSSKAVISWDVPADASPGSYRIVHYGDWKSGWDGSIHGLTGTSRNFQVF